MTWILTASQKPFIEAKDDASRCYMVALAISHTPGLRFSRCRQALRVMQAGNRDARCIGASGCDTGMTAIVTSLNAAISACEQGGQWVQALTLLHKMCDTA